MRIIKIPSAVSRCKVLPQRSKTPREATQLTRRVLGLLHSIIVFGHMMVSKQTMKAIRVQMALIQYMMTKSRYTMSWVNRFLIMHGKVIIAVFLRMVKPAQESLTRW